MAKSNILCLPCRYYRVFTDDNVSCNEANLQFVERDLPVPVAQAALVLVDVWSTHYIDSWLARAKQVTQERIVPLLEAARRIGMTVIHAPSPMVADRYTEPQPQADAPRQPQSDWPPAEFRGIYRGGEYSAFGRNSEPRLGAALDRYVTELDISPAIKPLPDEPIIHTGAELQALLESRQILHLFYAGFATNWCIILRDYGIYAMNDRGYNIILMRDATTGIEFHDTCGTLLATEIAIREIETKHGWSATTDAFVTASAGLRP